MASLKELLRELSEKSAPTGDESEVAEFMENHFRRHGFEVKRDVLGNVIAKKGKGAKKILVTAHMDEISMAVSAVTKEGFVKFIKVGGIYDGILGTARVTLHAKQRVKGIIGIKPPHLMKEEESKKLQESENLFIDVGAKDKKDAEAKGIRPGVPITFDTEFAELSPDLVVGKAFDDRSGCAILLRLAEEFAHVPKEVTLYLVGTVREETGLWGAGASAFAIEPDLAIAVDVGIAGGTPDVSEDVVPVRLGEGPGLGVMEGGGRGLIMPKRLVAWIEALAKKHKIKLQFEVLDRGSTDASRMQYSRAGFLAASISVPSRYIHSQNELLSLKDLEHTKELLKAIIHEFPHYR